MYTEGEHPSTALAKLLSFKARTTSLFQLTNKALEAYEGHGDLKPLIPLGLSAGSGGQLTLQSCLCKKRPEKREFLQSSNPQDLSKSPPST